MLPPKVVEAAKQAAETVRRRLEELEHEASSEARRLAEKHGLTLSQAQRYIELLGSAEEADTFFSTREHDIMKTIRVNTLKATRPQVASLLSEKGFEVEAYAPTPYGLIVKSEPIPVGATHEYMMGLYTVQGPASMLAVLALTPEAARLVLDACAGAGGKTTQIAQHTRAPILAVDASARKLLALKNNASRLGVTNVVAVKADLRSLVGRLNGFSHVLVDAPCSGEGLWPFQRGRWPRSPSDIASRVRLQVELLASAALMASEGAIIVYSTCSTSVEENELVVSVVADNLGLVEPEPTPVPGEPGVNDYLGYRLNSSVRYCRRLYPHVHRTEGFTICRLRRKAVGRP